MPAQVFVDSHVFSAMSELPAAEQSACVAFIPAFRENPSHPGFNLHPVEKARAKHLWSARVSRDLRFILFRESDAWVLLHVDRHDAAYRWAERREVGRHPVTGALQVLETIETVREVERLVERAPAAPRLFAGRTDEYLLSLGVPPDYLPVLREIGSEDELFGLALHLPSDVGERIVALAAGDLVVPPPAVAATAPLRDAAGASAQFYVLSDHGGLAAALAAPLDRWLAFLHPSQHSLVALQPRGPVKVTGSAGTGKTVVALHRARHLAASGLRVLVTSFVTTLCDNLQRALARLCDPSDLERVTVSPIHRLALRLVTSVEPGTSPADDRQVEDAIAAAAVRLAPDVERRFLMGEWDAVIAPLGISTFAEYRAARRTGRGRPLSVSDRKQLWTVYEAALTELGERRQVPFRHLCRRAEALIDAGAVASPFDAVLVDEIQDLRPAELRLVRALAARAPGGLMLFGDPGQRIYAGGFSLAALGIDIRGRSYVLRVNYRTTAEIRRAADRLLGGDQDDLDGGREGRAAAQSLLRGPEPTLAGFASRDAEIADAVAWIRARLSDGLEAADIGCFARTNASVKALATALESARMCVRLLEEGGAAADGIQLGTMHRAKGLEFKAVLVLDASDGCLPSKGALRASDDPADREAALERERQLLYVAMTRARDLLRVTWSSTPSPFLRPLLGDP